jgi:cell division protein FtsL
MKWVRRPFSLDTTLYLAEKTFATFWQDHRTSLYLMIRLRSGESNCIHFNEVSADCKKKLAIFLEKPPYQVVNSNTIIMLDKLLHSSEMWGFQMSAGAPTVRSLDARVDDLEKQFVQFKSRIELVISLLKWIGGFMVATIVTLIIQLVSISFSAGKLQEKVDAQTTAIQELKQEIHDLRKDIASLRDKPR